MKLVRPVHVLPNLVKYENLMHPLDCQKHLNAVLTVKYIVKSNCLPGQTAIDSNRKLSSTSIPQLHKTVLLIKTYRWLGILIGMLLLSMQITCLLFSQFANTISCPPSRTAGFTSVVLK